MSPRWFTRHALPASAPVVALIVALIGGSAWASPPRAGAAPAPTSGNCATTNGSWYQAGGASVPVHDEIGAEACYTRKGDTATINYSWGGVGRLREGTFTFQLVDCATNTVDARMSHTLAPPEATERGGRGYRTFAVTAGRQYKPRVFGQGSYDRTGARTGGDRTGHFNSTATPPFTGDGHCQ